MKTIGLALSLLVMLALPNLHAQWEDQSFALKSGWNAVYLNVDPSYTTLQTIVAANPNNPIDTIWLWKPVVAPDRYIANPESPADSNIDWASWTRNPAPSDTLARLIANAAYLVHNGSGSNFNWVVRGKPVPPSYSWASKGVNFLGFSTPQSSPPFFTTFLSPAPTLRSQGEFYRYDDGNNDLTPSLFNAFFNSTPVTRGAAYWIRWKDTFNRYFGAFDLVLQNSSGINFSDTLSHYSLRLKNNTAGPLTVQLTLLASALPPFGQTAIVGIPPVLIRGAVDTTTLTYTYTTLTTPRTVTLAAAGDPGSDVEVVLGPDRSSMPGNAGALYAGVLRLTDSLGYSQIDLPVSANVAGKSGLWVGSATVTDVRQYLNNYLRDTNGSPVLSEITSNGSHYVVTNVDTSLGKAKRPFHLRLIVHNSQSAGSVSLLERIYVGYDRGTNQILAAAENLLNPQMLSTARRISAPQLPWTPDNKAWLFGPGQFAPGGTMTATVNLDYNEQASNPFLHTYHPDHDNLNAEFNTILLRGEESYDVERKITLSFQPLPADFGSLTGAGSQLIGNYTEDMTIKGSGSDQRLVQTAGTFQLNRITSIDTITR